MEVAQLPEQCRMVAAVLGGRPVMLMEVEQWEEGSLHLHATRRREWP